MRIVDITPYQVIHDMLMKNYNNDKEFVNSLYQKLLFPKRKVSCQFWSYDWIVDIPKFNSVLNAMSILSKIYFSCLVFPVKHPEICYYIKNIILLLKNGIIHYGCKNPPYILKTYNMSMKELLIYGELICKNFSNK